MDKSAIAMRKDIRVNKNRKNKEGDIIKTIATVVPPFYVAFRLATGGPEVFVTSVALFSLVAIAHWTNLWPVDA